MDLPPQLERYLLNRGCHMDDSIQCVRVTQAAEEFRVDTGTWRQLLPMARQHGWDPEGAIFRSYPVRRHALEGAFTDYNPDVWFFSKIITEIDARKLARALRQAAFVIATRKATPISETRHRLLDNDLGAAAVRLAEWCDGGGFQFAMEE
jgi:hypothetical protein